MSRIGKRPIAVPSGITADVEGQTVKVKGPKGALQVVLHDDVAVKLEGGQIKVDPRADTKR
ncbi:MAG: 50S ribosomal protein L6, partial [Xanthobacteraceae bacterium]